MGPIRIRRVLRRSRSRFAVLLTLVALSGIVAAHHAGPMSDMHGMHGMAAMTVCLAVLAVAAIVTVRAIAHRPLDHRCPTVRPPRIVRLRPPPRHRARAGPIYLRLAVLRR